MNEVSKTAKWIYGSAIGLLILFMYIPMITVALASFSKSRYFKFPIPDWSTAWYGKVFESLSIQELFSYVDRDCLHCGHSSHDNRVFRSLGFRPL